jgi:hypothetical protein
LYRVSSRVSNAEASILRTGKANQLILQQMRADSLLGKTIDSIVGTTTGKIAAATLGGFGGPAGAGLAQALISALGRGSKDRIKAAADLLSSEEFIKAAEHAATKMVP